MQVGMVERWQATERAGTGRRRARGAAAGRLALPAPRRERERRAQAVSEVRGQGFAALLADVLEGDRPPAELLVAYARDAAALTPAERSLIEHHLAHTPGYRVELAVLRRFLAHSGDPVCDS